MITGLLPTINLYAGVQDQFEWLPKLQQLVAVPQLGFLPWWGWMLVWLFALQAIFVYALFEYVRRGSLSVGTGELPSVQVSELRGEIENTNKKLTEWVEELCSRIEQTSRHSSKQDEIAADAIARIKEQIAIDLPNAKTVSEAFRNLDDAVHSKVERTREETQAFSGRIKALELDAVYLLDFAADATTLRFLESMAAQSASCSH